MRVKKIKSFAPVWHIYKKLSYDHKKKCLFLLVFMLVTAVLEVASLGLVVPFLSFLTNESYISNIPILKDLLRFVDINYGIVSSTFISLLFILLAIMAMSARLLLLRFNALFIVAVGSNLSLRVLGYVLNQPYEYHLKMNTSDLIANIKEKVELTVFAVLLPVLTLISNSIISIALIITLIAINWKVALIVSLIFIPLYAILIVFSRVRLNSNSLSIQRNQPLTIKLIQEALGSIRDIILNSNKDVYIEKYKLPDYENRLAQAKNIVLASSPRFIMECTGMILIASLTLYYVSNEINLMTVLPSLGALALGAQRILPSLQQIYAAWASIAGYGTSADEVIEKLEILDNENKKIISNEIKFNNSIKFNKVSFAYYGVNEPIIQKIDFEIRKGDRVAIVGKTGSGKSTIIDLIIGLIKPTSGFIYIDDQKLNDNVVSSWQEKIALVPQTIFLSDESLLQNICLGYEEDKIDINRVKSCIKTVGLEDVIEKLPNRYQTKIGERGVRLSGGQRQRIGIARALYKKKKILILDEATNALDEDTENKIIKNIQSMSKDLTIIIISHRPQTLKFCNKKILIN